jgi:hypothetical protein
LLREQAGGYPCNHNAEIDLSSYADDFDLRAPTGAQPGLFNRRIVPSRLIRLSISI